MLWRRLVLDQDKKEGWNSSLIKLFDRKCGSRLKEVSIKVKFDQQTDVTEFRRIIEKNKETLLSVWIHSPTETKYLSELSLTLPHLVQCRIGDVKSETVHLIERENLEEHSQAVGNSSNLRVLWIDNAALFQKVGSFENLVSLWIEGLWDSSQWRGCLEKSQNLKHLRIKLRQSPIDSLVAPIHLHQLEVLELFLLSTEYPSWLIIPSTSTIILHSYQIPQGLPSISKLWIAGLKHIDRLATKCPQLEDLRLDILFRREKFDDVLKMLVQRKKNVEAGMRVDGIRMENIKRVILRTKALKTGFVKETKELVEKVINFEKVLNFVEVEI